MSSGWRLQKLAMVAAALLLAGCSSMRTRTFAADHDGAVNAIKVMLAQERPDSLQLVLKQEPAKARAHVWRSTSGARLSEGASGVITIDRSEADGSLRARSYAPTAEGAMAAEAFRGERPASRSLMVRGGSYQSREPHAWRWFTTAPTSIHAFDSGLCVEYECADFADIRSVWATPNPFGVNSVATYVPESFPVNRDGALAAILAATAMRGQVSVEISAPAGVERTVFLSTVSVLEDGRICGEAHESPFGVAERCYSYTQVERIEVRDRNTTFADALGDTLTAPFKVVGAAAVILVLAVPGN